MYQMLKIGGWRQNFPLAFLRWNSAVLLVINTEVFFTIGYGLTFMNFLKLKPNSYWIFSQQRSILSGNIKVLFSNDQFLLLKFASAARSIFFYLSFQQYANPSLFDCLKSASHSFSEYYFCRKMLLICVQH